MSTSANAPAAPAAPSPNRYAVVAAAAVTQAVVIGGLFAYGVFFAELEAAFGWSRTLLSAATSLAFFTMGMLTMLAGRISDRHGPRLLLAVTGTLTGLNFILLSMLSAPWQLLLSFGLLFGAGLATHDVVTLSTIAKWFDRKRGIMTSLVKVGTALGQVIAPPLAAWLILSVGWRRAFLIIGIGALLLLLLAAWRTIPNPASRAAAQSRQAAGSPGQLERKEPQRKGPQEGMAFAEARRTVSFIKLCLVQLLLYCIVISVPTHLFIHGRDLGLGAGEAAALLSTMGGFSIVGRLLVGSLVDRVGSKPAMALAFGFMALSLVGLMLLRDPLMLFAVVALYGVTHGGYFTVMSPAVAEHFGMRAHGAIFGAVLFFSAFGGALGPLMTGWLFDRTGSYAMAFAIMALFAALAFLLAISMQPPRSLSHASSVSNRR